MGGGVEERAARPSLFHSALATYATNLAVAVLSLGNVLVVARSLGPQGRGGVAFLTTVLYLTSSMATFGVEEANANIAGREARLRRSVATNSLLLALGLGGLGAGAVVLLVSVVPGVGGDTDRGLLLLSLAAVPIVVFKIFLEYTVRAEYGHARANAAWLLEAITNVAANSALALTGSLGVGRAVGVWVAGQSLAAIVLSSHVVKRGSGFGRPNREVARRQLGFGLKAHAGRVLTLGNYRLDQWIVGALAGSRELGLYSVAVAWAETLYFLPTALAATQRPDLVRASPAEAAQQSAAAARMALLLTVPPALGIVLAAPVLVVTIFGDLFRGAVDDLRALAWGGFGIVLLKLLGSGLTAQGKPLRATAGVAVAVLATILLDILLVPSYGGLGAAVAATAAYTAGGAFTWILFARAFGLRKRELAPRRSDLAAVGAILSRFSGGRRGRPAA